MPPKLRVVAHNAKHEHRMQNEISTSLASVLRTNPKMTPKEAMWSVTNQMLANNPYQPPKDGKCPINDLPDEILGHIFLVGVKEQEEEEEGDDSDDEEWEDVDSDEDDDDSDEDDDGSVDEAAGDSGGLESLSDSDDEDEVNIPFQVLASHVCRRWREVALDSHILWTSLDFAKRPQLEKAKVYISRSQGLPLNLYIDCTFPEDIDEEDHPDHPLYHDNEVRRKAHVCDDDDCISEHTDDDEDDVQFLSQKEFTQILDLIEPEVSRWQSLDFRASTYGYVHLLVSRLHTLPSAPLLESMQICHFEDCDDYEFFSGDDKTSYLPFHGIAPLLKEVALWGVHIDWEGPLLRGLHNLELSYHAKDVRPSYKAFVDIIKGSPDLHTLTLSLSGPVLPEGVAFDADPEVQEGAWGPTPLTIPSLRELALQFHETKYAIALAQHIDVPGLTSLVLNFDEEDYSPFVQVLVKPLKDRTESVLQRIENLKVAGLPCDVASVEAFLGQLGKLKSMNLKVMGEEEATIFQKLINPYASRPSATSPTPTAGGLPAFFCPQLEAITTNQINGSQLKDLVTARQKFGVPLKRVFMSHYDHITKKEEKWLRANVEELDFFEPSDSDEDEDIELIIEHDEDGLGGSDDESESESGGEDDGEEPPRDENGEPLISPLARHMRRGRGRRAAGGADLD
ncbi:hypothetical protein GALMADRAFT_57896 [Galerina marginata CBS 339.88]|uniref:Uncharacterized protein n=1 Tax=Galerina marginata (strain CBS 339.88) TaxID=685588 RepID=A0A067THP7_GALM3|nr:hypothetical protein GALMADRAFT_57896 [Galerina marginata CBS 339.88]